MKLPFEPNLTIRDFMIGVEGPADGVGEDMGVGWEVSEERVPKKEERNSKAVEEL